MQTYAKDITQQMERQGSAFVEGSNFFFFSLMATSLCLELAQLGITQQCGLNIFVFIPCFILALQLFSLSKWTNPR